MRKHLKVEYFLDGDNIFETLPQKCLVSFILNLLEKFQKLWPS